MVEDINHEKSNISLRGRGSFRSRGKTLLASPSTRKGQRLRDTQNLLHAFEHSEHDTEMAAVNGTSHLNDDDIDYSDIDAK